MLTAAARPAEGEFAPYYGKYIAKVPEGDIVELLETQLRDTLDALRSVSEERAGFRYAPGKWSIREVVSHLSDVERVFTYRALYFARGGQEPLPAMDENAWAEIAGADRRTLPDVAAEFASVRAATVAMFRSLTDADYTRGGVASGQPVTVRALAWIIAGHERHHLILLRERYGV